MLPKDRSWIGFCKLNSLKTILVIEKGRVFNVLPHVINTGDAAFLARGEMWTVASDNPNFELICELLRTGCMDEDRLIQLTSTSQLVLNGGGDRVTLDGACLSLDGERLPASWLAALTVNPDLIRILLVRVGDEVLVQGDEDAPDGRYTVVDVDNNDPKQRIYLETEEGFFGYPQSSSIKEVYHETG